MASTLSLPIVMPYAEMTWPRYATEGTPKVYFKCLRKRSWASRALKTRQTCCETQRVVDQNVVKDDEHRPTEEGAEDVIHERLECGWHKETKGMTRNSMPVVCT